MLAFATVLALATSAFALQVTQPTNATGFSNSGQNTVSWTRVSTDPSNFTIVLVNNNEFPNYSQVLAALVDAGDSSGTIQVNPPSTGWPSGSGYQINLAHDAQALDQLLAQSQDFSFHAPSSSSSVSGSGSSVSSTASRTVLSVSGSPTDSATPSDSSGSGSQTSDVSTSPSPTNGAATMGVQAMFFGIVALVGAVLA